jgi:hypothetical protein
MKSDSRESAETTTSSTESARNFLTLLYLQIAFLAVSYFLGAWGVAAGGTQTYYSPLSIGHILTSIVLVALAGVAAPLALIRGQRLVAALNMFLLGMVIVGGAVGIESLGNPEDTALAANSNLFMMVIMGAGVLCTALSLARNLPGTRGEEVSPSRQAIYVDLGALATTMIAGGVVSNTSLSDLLWAPHMGLAAVTFGLVLGALVISLYERPRGARGHWSDGREVSLFGALAALAFTAASGIITLGSGSSSLVIGMEGGGVLGYLLLMLSLVLPTVSTAAGVGTKPG